MKRLISLLLLLLALAACTASNSTGEQVSSVEESVSAEESVPTIEPTPTIRPDMEASDPATFVRAAGHPQFVEFFAFW